MAKRVEVRERTIYELIDDHGDLRAWPHKAHARCIGDYDAAYQEMHRIARETGLAWSLRRRRITERVSIVASVSGGADD